MSYARDLIPAELWNRLGVVLPPEGSEHEESCPVSFAGGGQCRCYRAPLVAAVREVIAGLIFTDYSAPIPAKAPDPVPAEIRERITRAREALSVVSVRHAGGDYLAKWREVAGAKRELADAYEAAYGVVDPSLTLSDALLDLYFALRSEADAKEREACEFERRLAESRGQA